jgi:hypothetical protein
MKIIFSAVVMFFSLSVFSASLHLEGSCAGKLADGSSIVFQYYSNFNGCQKVARAGISYQQGREGMVTGSRSFTEKSDIYAFGKVRLIFANSTGNTTGKYRYTDGRGDRQSVVLQCDVRDYEYAECH